MGDPALIHGMTQRRLSRRDLLVRGAAGALAIAPLAAACGGSAAKPPVKVGDPAWWRAQRSTGELVFANWPLYIDYRNWLKDRPTLNDFGPLPTWRQNLAVSGDVRQSAANSAVVRYRGMLTSVTAINGLFPLLPLTTLPQTLQDGKRDGCTTSRYNVARPCGPSSRTAPVPRRHA